MTSLRLRLFILVAAVTVLVWAGAATWTAISTRVQLERVLDRRLVEAARMVAALDIPVSGAASGAAREVPSLAYSHQLSCQIWSLSGTLIGRSAGAPSSPLADGQPGFSERRINQQVWRAYTHIDAARGVRVMVGDNIDVRQRLVRNLVIGLLLPAAIGLVVLAALLWLGVRRGLRPLDLVAQAIKARSPDRLTPLALDRVPDELQPLVTSMDGLFAQLDDARRAEREFVANAAHELQTPLAGLKTQAEVARRATDPAMRDHALEKIMLSVDRTSRLVRQLLDLARHQGQPADKEICYTRLSDAVGNVERDFGLLGHRNGGVLEVECSSGEVEIALDREALRLAIGNLVENAINHGGGGRVRIECALGEMLEVRIVDEGPGIPNADIARVRRRFERGRQARSTGTGLGLSIVEATIAQVGGTLELRQTELGFAAILRFPRAQLRLASTGRTTVREETG